MKSVTRLLIGIGLFAVTVRAGDLDWPVVTREMKPWAYNWWMGSAVDPTNLTKELTRYRDAGMGGIHIIPIYGAKGWEEKYIEYLSPQWMAMLGHTVTEADRLGLGVDMTTGTGWCFGGPDISAHDANVVTKDGKTMKPTMKVKRAAPGGSGYMLNPFYADAMRHYLERFTDAFAKYDGPKPRAMYHDSYEYNCNWSPDLPAEFERRRGYKLPIAELFGPTDNAQLKADYRETISDMMIEGAWPVWNKWCREHGFVTRDQAHGSPANLLDLYALADVPETEMFHTDRDKFISKFASSAAHVAGRKLVAAETGTWLNEHFTETLADMKGLVDDLFLSGINHVIYHGTCYSPDEAPWPGWVFYAATEMNPRNAIWRDVPALNAYIARCQSILQAGQPDNDVLLYWPIHDLWHDPAGLTQNLTVHKREWFHGQPIGAVAKQLWNTGYGFDYISDRQLLALSGRRVIVVPPCKHMPAATKRALDKLAADGCTVLYEGKLPAESLRETLVDTPGLLFIRRASDSGRYYFIANQGAQTIDQLVPLATKFAAVVIMDPMTGRIGLGSHKGNAVHLQLDPGHSIILRTFVSGEGHAPSWPSLQRTRQSASLQLQGTWQVKFLQGGPELPPSYQTNTLASWTKQGGEAERFAGTAVYRITFDAPAKPPHLDPLPRQTGERKTAAIPSPLSFKGEGQGEGVLRDLWWLDLGKVCESARVRLNGKELGTLIMPPYRVVADGLKATGNVLEVEVTNLSANRIRDLDRRKIVWRNFHDTNFVNIDYKPFDASQWPVRESGLLGPVTLIPVNTIQP